MNTFISRLMMVVLGAFFLIPRYLTLDMIWFLSQARSTVGTVTGIYKTSKGRRPEITFLTSTGGRHTFVRNYSGLWVAEVGSVVDVLYLEEEPSKAFENSVMGLWGTQIISGVFIGGSFVSFARGGREKRKADK